MVALDHMILRVANPAASAQFYVRILGFAHEGKAGPFEILRVSDGFTIDLLGEPPKDRIHLAFSLDRSAFDAVHEQLVQGKVPFGSAPADRSGGPPAKALGARGMADALYFYDPDGHNLEIRLDEQSAGGR